MSIAFFIYLANVLPSLGVVMAVIAIIGTIIAAIVAGHLCDTYDTEKQWATWRKCVAGLGCAVAIAVLIPSERTMYLMAGASVVQKAIESPEMQAINSKVLAIINGKLDEYTKEPKK